MKTMMNIWKGCINNLLQKILIVLLQKFQQNYVVASFDFGTLNFITTYVRSICYILLSNIKHV